MYSLFIPKDPRLSGHPLFEHFLGKEVFGSESQLRAVNKAMRRLYCMQILPVTPGKKLPREEFFISLENHTIAVHRKENPRTIYVGLWDFNNQIVNVSKVITW